MLDIQNPTHKHFLVTYLSNLMFETGFCGFAIYHSIPILSIKAYERKSFPSGAVVKNSPANAADVGLIPGLGRSPGEGNGTPLQYSWPGKFYGQRSLAGYSPWGCKKSDITE